MARPIPRPAHVTQEMLEYLDGMRDMRRIPNMFGATPFIEKAFSLDEPAARSVLYYWSESLPERHPS